MRAPFAGTVAVGLLLVAIASLADAQTLSTAELEGTWSLFQIVAPRTAVSASDVRTFTSVPGSPLTFDATGAVTAGTVQDDQLTPYTVGGSLALSIDGLVTGTLTLDDGVDAPLALTLREGRILLNKHTIVGASSVADQVGLFTLVKLEAGAAGAFTLEGDLAGDWNYHEITPTNDIPRTGGDAAGDASWITGSITFHGENGCTEADLTLADGTLRAERDGNPTSFG